MKAKTIEFIYEGIFQKYEKRLYLLLQNYTYLFLFIQIYTQSKFCETFCLYDCKSKTKVLSLNEKFEAFL